jgi:hypothetical protein
MTTYHVTVTRDSGLWAAMIDGLPSQMISATDVERFAELDLEVRDLVAGLTDVNPDSFDLTWKYVVNGHDVTGLLTALAGSERAYQNAVTAREAARRELIRAFSGAHMSQSVIGDVLGLSHQRVHQLIKAD